MSFIYCKELIYGEIPPCTQNILLSIIHAKGKQLKLLIIY